LSRILDRAVQYALMSGLVGCAAKGPSGSEPDVSQGDVSVNPAETDEPEATNTGTRPSTDSETVDEVEAGAAVEPPTVDPGAGYETLPCTEQQPWDFANMHFAREVDFIALRSAWNAGPEPTEAASYGQACQGPDAAGCEADLQVAWPEPTSEWARCSQVCVYNALVTTLGDEVEVLQTQRAIQELLGTIDSLDEAALWVQANNGEVACDSASGRTTGQGYEIAHSLTLSDCPVQTANVVDRVSPDGTIVELSREVQPATNVCVGRRPEGLLALERSDTGHRVGDYFAEVARLEAAAIAAFDKIHAELRAFGAPETLRQQALAARRDELRHTAETAALARRYGGTPQTPELAELPLRSLFEAARDNLIEGCIRETYGAACAKYQARHARDPEVRRVLTQIAVDETRHAELSWAMHAWFHERLTDAERERLEADRAHAITQLQRELREPVALELNVFAGVPSTQHALALLEALDLELWRVPRAA
jgi:hypothetical protein